MAYLAAKSFAYCLPTSQPSLLHFPYSLIQPLATDYLPRFPPLPVRPQSSNILNYLFHRPKTSNQPLREWDLNLSHSTPYTTPQSSQT